MMKGKADKKKYWIYGIIGCICFGIGDWLLGYVDPSLTQEAVFYFIRAGHGVNYNITKAMITLALAMAGMLFYFPAMVHIGDVATDKRAASRLQYTFGLCSAGWLVIHFIVTVNVIVYSWMTKNADSELAGGISALLEKTMLPCLYIAYIFVAVPLIIIIADILRGKTRLRKQEVIFTPLIWMAVINVVAGIIPASPFSYGLYTFSMNGGMLVWFLYLMIKELKQD